MLTTTFAPAETLAAIRERRPLVHQITNFVVMAQTANITLAFGALPVMAHALEEVEEMAAAAGSLVLNIGTLESAWVEAMIRAGRAANASGVPVVLDPVGAGATRLRTESARRILEEVEVTLVRGNPAEVATLAGESARISGVESLGAGDPAALADTASARLGCTVAVTGAVDHVAGGGRHASVANGSPWLTTVTGTGCMSTTACAAFAAILPGDPVRAAAEALAAYGTAAEIAAEGARGPGSFHVALYDAVAALDAATLERRCRITAR